MGVYRTSVRFDLRNEREKRAADYLKSLKHGEGNRFIVDAVLARIDSSDDTGLLAQIRQMLREEVKLVPAAAPTANDEHTNEQSLDVSVLDDLKMFG